MGIRTNYKIIKILFEPCKNFGENIYVHVYDVLA